MTDPARFEETQAFRSWWIVLLLVLIAAGSLGVFGWGLHVQLVQGVPWGDKPMPDGTLIAVALAVNALTLGLLALFALMQLHVRVDERGIHVRFRPFVRRRIAFGELRAFAAVTYRPIREYGGWGIRGLGANKAYNVRGNRGVRVIFTDGRRLLIGSQRAEELERAIADLSGMSPGPANRE